MTTRQLKKLAIVAAGMVAVTILLYAFSGVPRATFGARAFLVQGLDPAKVGNVTITRVDEAVDVRLTDDGFVVTELSNYPASVEKLNELIVSVMDIRCAERMSDASSRHEAFGVAEASDTVTIVTFKDREGKTLVELFVGEPAPQDGGTYVRLAGQNAVYRTEEPLAVRTQPLEYVDKNLVAVKAVDVERVAVVAGEDRYAIARKDGALALEEMPEGKRAKEYAVDGVADALSSLYFEGVSRADGFEADWTGSYEATLKGGLVYAISLAEQDGKHYVKISARGPDAAAVKKSIRIGENEGDASLAEKEAVLLAAETAPKFNARHASWVYQISQWNADKLQKPLADLVEDAPAPESQPASDSEAAAEASESETPASQPAEPIDVPAAPPASE